MASLGYVGALGSALSNIGVTLSIGHGVQREIWRTRAGLNVLHWHPGEYNRYDKEHQTPIPIDQVPVSIPSAVKGAEYAVYKHSPLPQNRDEIRLLELLPATFPKSRDFIACRLLVRRLSEVPQYEALSYTWGTLARDVPIFVVPNPPPEELVVSEALPVTPQLYAALKRLRRETTSRYLWVDQICIDQTNNNERSQQVLLMDKIYEGSIQTIIWLGEEDQHCGPFEEMIYLLNDEADPKADVATVTYAFAADRGFGNRRQDAVTNLLNRDWFTRAWVFQEAVLSKELFVRCGGMEVPFVKLKRLIDAVMRVQYNAGGYARSLIQTTVGFETVDLIQHARQRCEDESCQRFVEPNFLAVLFEAMQQFRATDSRDLIYAFLASRFQNLQPKNRIIPDYDKSVEWVWTDATRRIITEAQSLSVFAAGRGCEVGNLHVPSWVPDWSYCFRYGRPIAVPGCKSSFKACLGRPHITDDAVTDFTTLLVKGKAILKIGWLAPRNFEVSYYRDGINEFLDLNGHVETLKQHLAHQRRLTAEQVADRWPDLAGAVLRTLLADGAYGTVQPLPEKTKELQRVLSDEKKIMDMKRKMDACEHVPNPSRWQEDYVVLEKLFEWALIAQKKVLFTTKAVDSVDGPDSIHLGLSASAVQVNDVIALLHGSQVPVVLRPADGGENQWHVISQCYLEGWMYKSDAENNVWWDEADGDYFLLI
ncbi:HET-domain-containing protein [Hyaloscypha variabilis F]|uniref:HET-domain-containing protein n=1 Tax=Hyaloscypha variabilis (strain UAMH 11265 / GT02V1 / F) TaxID=1149755 RepID=A0A2J6SBK4_HYAVF|nr:HET-domain-containing protein [Hyaloscypha variabilis F]